MAYGKNTGLQYRPLQGDLASDILDQEDQAAKMRAEQRLNADRKARAEAEKEKARKEGLGRIKHIDLYDTDSDSLNSVLAETVTLAQQEYDPIFKVLDDKTGKYSKSEQIKAKLKLEYLNEGGLVNDLKIMTNAVMGEYQEYEKNLTAGKIFRDEAFEKRFENGFKGVSLSLDDSLRPVAIFKNTGEDLDGDGVLDVETMGSLNDIYARPQFQSNFNYDSAVKQHSEKLVSAVNQTVDGFTTTKTTGVEDNLLEDSVKRFLYNDDGTPADPMLAFLRQRGMDSSNPENLKQIENDYKNDIYIRTKRGSEKDIDAGAIVANKKENRLSKENKTSISEPVTPTEATWGKQYKNIDSTKVNSVPVNGVKIPAIPLKDGRTITDGEIVNYTYGKNGEMIVDVVYQDTKTETMSTSKYDEELKDAIDSGDNDKVFNLKGAIEVEGGKKVTLPGQKKKEQIIISKENESKIAGALDMSIKDMKARAMKDDSNNNGVGSKYNN